MELIFNEIHKEYCSKILNYFSFKINDNETAEELTNDVFVKVYEHLDEYDESISKMNTWVFNIAKNVLIDYFRKRKLQTSSMGNYLDDNGDESLVHSDYSNPEKVMVNNELGEQIHLAINSLPKKQSAIMNKFLVEQLSHEEIANLLAIPIGTVKATINRAKEILREKLINF